MATQIGTKGENLDLLIRQGATFGPITVTLTNPDTSSVNLTGGTVRGQVRKTYDAVSAAASFDCALVTPASGIFSFAMSAASTGALTAGALETDEASAYLWDLEFVDSAGLVTPLIYGDVQVFREITR